MCPFPKSEGLMYVYKLMASICTKLDFYNDIFMELFVKSCLLSSQGYLLIDIWTRNISGILCDFFLSSTNDSL